VRESGGGGTSAGKIPARSARERGIPQEDRAERKNGEAAAEEGRGRVGGGGGDRGNAGGGWDEIGHGGYIHRVFRVWRIINANDTDIESLV
jgi:hypothetical protein